MKQSIKSVLFAGAAALALLWIGRGRAISGVFYPDGATTLHFAFEGSPNGDRPIIRPPATYYPEDGFGFVNSPELVGTSRGVTAPKYFRFDVNVPPGIYEVSVISGGTSVDSNFSINAEGKPTSATNIQVAPRQSVTSTFTVTVKQGEKPAESKSMDSDACLNLEFTGTNPSMMKLDIKPAEKGG
jgi:hypothetical protein